MWIPRRRINALLAHKGAPPIDSLLVSMSLAQEDVLARADFSGGEEGWLVKRLWWDEQLLRVAAVPPRVIFQRFRVGKLPKVKTAG